MWPTPSVKDLKNVRQPVRSDRRGQRIEHFLTLCLWGKYGTTRYRVMYQKNCLSFPYQKLYLCSAISLNWYVIENIMGRLASWGTTTIPKGCQKDVMYKNVILYFNFPKSTPGPPPSPYLVWIQDSEFARNFGPHPLGI